MKPLTLPAFGMLAAIAIAGCSNPRTASQRYIDAGDRYMKTEQWSAAAIEYRNAIKRAPDVIEGHARLADVSSVVGDKQTAATERLWIAKSSPRDLEAQMAAGRACLEAGRPDDAQAPMAEASLLAAQQAAPNRDMAKLYMETGYAEKAEPHWKIVSLAPAPDGDPFALADFYAATDRLADAEGELKKLSALPGKESPALLRLAQLLYAHDLPREGDQTLETLLARDPRNEAAWILRGQILLRRGSEAAQEAFLNAMTSDPSSIDALTGLTVADVASHRTKQAVARIEDRLRQTPDNVPMLILAARTYAAGESFEEAEQMLTRALRLEPKNADAQALMGRVYLGQGRTEDARVAFERAAQIAPDSVEANTLVAMIAQARGHWTDARQRYERVLEADPRAAVAANNLAWLDLEDGRLDEALRYGLVAHRELHGVPHVDDTLGWIYYQSNRPGDALPLLAAAVEAQPTNVLFHYHLGMAYSKDNNAQGAKEELTRALALSPSFTGSEEAQSVLARLKKKTAQK